MIRILAATLPQQPLPALWIDQRSGLATPCRGQLPLQVTEINGPIDLVDFIRPPLIFRFGAGLTPTGDVQLICATNTLDPVFWDASPRRLLASFVPGQWQLASPTARQRRRQRLSTASSPVKSTTFGPEGGGPEGGDKDGNEDGDKKGDSSDQDSGFRIQNSASRSPAASGWR